MSAPALRRATYEDVLRAPAHMIAEIIFGALHTQPRPADPHAGASSHLGSLITGPLGRFERVDVDRLAPRYPALPQVLAKGWQGSQAARRPGRHDPRPPLPLDTPLPRALHHPIAALYAMGLELRPAAPNPG